METHIGATENHKRRIQFDGPEDLSVNHDLYVSGEGVL